MHRRWWCACLWLVAGLSALVLIGGCSASSVVPLWRDIEALLPIERDAGTDTLSSAEVALFTRELAAFYDRHDLFRWILETSHGMAPEVNPHEFRVWWTNVDVVKRGGEVTFHHSGYGTPDNTMIPTSRVLGHAAAAYMMTADSTIGRLVELYCKGVVAKFRGMVWDSTDTEHAIMARAVIPESYETRLADGRRKKIDYSVWRRETDQWNTKTIRIRNNPYWGDVYVKNMRSKDDLPHLFRAAFFVHAVAAEGAHAPVRAAADTACRYLERFARDIVDNDYAIRTRDRTGRIYIPNQDLATFTTYDAISPYGECTSKLTVALMGYGRSLGNRCGDGYGTVYQKLAPRIRYYNLAIIRGFHMSAALWSFLTGRNGTARGLLKGLVVRMGDSPSFEGDFDDISQAEWDADHAAFLLQSAACGIPLRPDEVRKIHHEFRREIRRMDAWRYWNVWSDTIPDGTYPRSPRGRLDIDDVGLFFEYCYSPLRSRHGAPCVDCDELLEPWRGDSVAD